MVIGRVFCKVYKIDAYVYIFLLLYVGYENSIKLNTVFYKSRSILCKSL